MAEEAHRGARRQGARGRAPPARGGGEAAAEERCGEAEHDERPDALAEREHGERRDAALEADDRRHDREIAALQRAEEEQEAADLQHACQHGIAERSQFGAPGRPSSASASGIVRRPLPTRISREARYGSTLRLTGTSQ